MKKPVTSFPLLKVRWLDHASAGGWHFPKDRADQTKKGLVCESVGFRIQRTKHTLTLAQTVEEQGKVNDTITIVVPAIVSVRRLK